MLAISLIKNGDLKLLNKGLKKLKPNMYRVKVLYSGICSSDIPRAFKKGAYNYPLVMGHEISGVIIKKGSKTNKYNINDYVSIYPLIPNCKNCNECKNENYNLCEKYSYYGSRQDGGFSEFIDVNEWNIYKLNKKINMKLASLIEPTAVAYNTFQKVPSKLKDKKILIIGCGFLGQILTRILYENNYKNLTCIDRNKFKLDYLKNFSKKLICGDLNLLKNSKFDCIVDFIGIKKTLDFSLTNLKPKGRLVLPANIYENYCFQKDKINLIARKELEISGVWNSIHLGKKSHWSLAERFLIRNYDNIQRVISHEIELSDAINFFNFLNNYKKNKKNKNNYLKAIIRNSF